MSDVFLPWLAEMGWGLKGGAGTRGGAEGERFWCSGAMAWCSGAGIWWTGGRVEEWGLRGGVRKGREPGGGRDGRPEGLKGAEPRGRVVGLG